VIAAFVWLCLSLFIQGVWLEGRPAARWLEWLRIAAAFALAMLTLFVWPAIANVALAIAAYASLSTIAVAVEQLRASPRLATAQ
jgi:hypothetical protein